MGIFTKFFGNNTKNLVSESKTKQDDKIDIINDDQVGYYRLLNIATNASKDKIEQSYLLKIKEYESYINLDTERQKEKLKEAYNVLSNSRKKDLYDRGRYEFDFFIEYNSLTGINVVDIDKYKTDIINLTCTCIDWQETRNKYKKDDPRRLCKHILRKFEYLQIHKLNIPDYLLPFESLIRSRRAEGKGIHNYKNVVFLKDSTIFIINDGENFDIYLRNNLEPYLSNRHLHLYNGPYYFDDSLSRKKFPKYLYNWSSSSELRNIKTPKSNQKLLDAIEYIKKEYGVVIMENDVNPRSVFYDEYTEQKKLIDDAWSKGYLLTKMFEYSLPEYVYKNNRNEALLKYNKYINLIESEILEFDITVNLLKINNIMTLKTIDFHKTLVHMGYLCKSKSLNQNNWIIIGDGLKFGMNYVHSYGMYSHIKIPDWYIISRFDFETLEYKKEQRYGLMYTTKAMWNRKKFLELVLLVEKFKKEFDEIKEDEDNLRKEIDSKEKKVKDENRKLKRKLELNGIRCPNCNSDENIHKKDIRQRKAFKVQRYQCMECKKVFQEVIEE